MFVTHLLYSVIEDTASGCKIKKSALYKNLGKKNSRTIFLPILLNTLIYIDKKA